MIWRRVGPEGVEPPPGGYQPPVLPLNHEPGLMLMGSGPGGARIHVCGASDRRYTVSATGPRRRAIGRRLRHPLARPPRDDRREVDRPGSRNSREIPPSLGRSMATQNVSVTARRVRRPRTTSGWPAAETTSRWASSEPCPRHSERVSRTATRATRSRDLDPDDCDRRSRKAGR